MAYFDSAVCIAQFGVAVVAARGNQGYPVLHASRDDSNDGKDADALDDFPTMNSCRRRSWRISCAVDPALRNASLAALPPAWRVCA